MKYRDDRGRPLVAIVGAAGLFPGSESLDRFWANVLEARDCSSEPPPGRWIIPPELAYGPEIGKHDRVYTTRGYFLPRIPPDLSATSFESKLLRELDPSVHLAIHIAREALASVTTSSADLSRAGLILGHIALPTEKVSQLAREMLEPLFVHGDLGASSVHPWNRHVAGLPAIMAAKALNLGLGGVAFDAACASSLYAVKFAVDRLQSHNADVMIAGGLSRPDSLYTQMGFAQLRALSVSGRCSPFDAAADGLVVGEGGGAVVLKRLDDAIAAGDDIWGVIAGIGLSNDREGNVLAPASEGQLRAMRAAYAEAGWQPDDVEFLECHATGTPLGDAVEYRSMSQLRSGSTRHCALGAVKATTGHLLTGAGAAGLIKTLLAMRHGILPPMTNFSCAGGGIDENNGIRFLRAPEAWPKDRKRAAVSAFGFGGINAHLLIEEFTPRTSGVHVDATPHMEPIAVVGRALREFGDDFVVDVPLGRFPIPPAEFAAMMPSQAMMLVTAEEAVGALKFNDLNRTSVVIGCQLDLQTTNFHFRWSQPDEWRDEAGPPLTPERVLGHLASVTASRIARCFKIGGPSFVLSSEESSGLDALRLGIEHLRRGDVNAVIVGAVGLCSDVRDEPGKNPNNVAVALVLERRKDAERAGHSVIATIDIDAAVPADVLTWPTDTNAGAASDLMAIARAIDSQFDQVCVIPHSGTAAIQLLRNTQWHEVSRDQTTDQTFRIVFSRIPFEIKPSRCFTQEQASPNLFASVADANHAIAKAHAEYLKFAQSSGRNVAQCVQAQQSCFEDGVDLDRGPFMDRDQCLQFAIGQVGPVLGPAFAEVDSFPTRVRLPDEPLMLVDRIMSVEGEPQSLNSGRVMTEHDVTSDRWYLDHGRIPTCIAVEAGQADLFLSGYLGIDFHTRGLAVYRLLDAVVTFHGPLPRPDSTIRYDIHIDRFFRQGDTHLFRFRFEGTVHGEPLLTMTEGCAGFFTPAELDAGQGIVQTALDRRPDPRQLPDDWVELATIQGVESYSESQLDRLRAGDLVGCFGSDFARLRCHSPMRLPDGLMKLVHRVPFLDFKAGRFGLGLIRGEADVHPDDWYLTCHFVDDMVMPGTLMYECCLHTLRIYLMRLGWVGEQDQVAWEPLPGIASRLKCRGQVTADTELITYEVVIKELGYRPQPYALADVLMYADGKAIVEMTNMSIQLTGMTREKLLEQWTVANTVVRNAAHHQLTAIYDHDRILAFAVGNPSEAFGNRYRVFDSERVIARLPAPPYQFLDRIVDVTGPPWVMKAGTSATAEYDVPPDAWYFSEFGRPMIPYAVLLEIALQPCGWLAAYMGSALTSDIDLKFRNLGGSAVQHCVVGPQCGTLVTTVAATGVSSSGGMIIQNYEFRVALSNGDPVFEGATYFGFFSAAALTMQVGIREPAEFLEPNQGLAFTYPEQSPFPRPGWRLFDRITNFVPDGGPISMGYIEGVMAVDPADWFFAAHFYQDPVMPGSLGIEAFLQLVDVLADRRWGPNPRRQFVTSATRHNWLYRGQVIPSNREVTVRAWVNTISDETRTLTASGELAVDGRTIYRMTDFTVQG